VSAYYLDWLNLVLRWAHVITGIAWIGSSFYFIWLDARLNVPPHDPENADVAGDLWAVHGGGFYHSQKYKVAPAQLPEPLHWFKWEAYFTWMTGFALFIVVYYVNAGTLLVDPASERLAPWAAVLVSVVLVIAGWLIYDLLNRLRLPNVAFVAIGSVLLLALCWGVAQLFTGRGAYMQVGVMLGTIMVANVAHVIIPSQRQMVSAKLAGQVPDAQLGLRAKQRSVHNNYLTLPVVFAMLSPHFPFTYAHPYNWLLLFVIFVGGALVRHWFNLRNRGARAPLLPVAASVLAIVLVVVLHPRRAEQATIAAAAVEFASVRRIIDDRCVACHSAKPTHPTAPVAAGGVMLDSAELVRAWASRIHERAVVTRTMPLANLTQMTEEERSTLGRWYQAGAPAEP
jgi:uncharacterized membrane protein